MNTATVTKSAPESHLGDFASGALAGAIRNYLNESYDNRNLSHDEVLLGVCELLKESQIIDSHNIF